MMAHKSLGSHTRRQKGIESHLTEAPPIGGRTLNHLTMRLTLGCSRCCCYKSATLRASGVAGKMTLKLNIYQHSGRLFS